MQILVVDDDFTMLRLLQKILQSAGHSVRVAGSGFEAVQCLRSGFPCDVVITDLNMPGMSGADLFKAVRDSKTLPVMPEFVLLTATTPGSSPDQVARLKDAVDLGFASVLFKPVDRVHLLHALIHLKGAKTHPSSTAASRCRVTASV